MTGQPTLVLESGDHSVRRHLILVVTVTVLVVAAAAVAAGWPYWRDHPRLAGANVAGSVAYVVAGLLMARTDRARRCGVLVAAAGLCWLASWLMSWNTSVLPLLGLAAQSLYWFLFLWSLLLYPGSRLRLGADRLLVSAGFVTLF